MLINTTPFNVAAIVAAAGDSDKALPIIDAAMLKTEEQIADDGAQVTAGASTRELMTRESVAAADAFNS